MRWVVCFIIGLAASSVPATADDWPQWLGPRRDGVWREAGVVERLPPGGPRVRWRAPVAGGYAGPAVVNGRVYVTDWVTEKNSKPAPDASGRRVRRGKERVLCLDDKDGTVIWTHEYDCPYGIDYAAGPRATPVVEGDRVYTLGAEGHLVCLDAATGNEQWTVRVAGVDGPVPIWGTAAHPLIDGDKIITLTSRPGAVAAAFDKRTGEPLWSALSARSPGYCPPMIVEAAGVRQLIIFHPESVNSLDPETGKVYWTVPHVKPVENDVSITTPRHFRDANHGDLLHVSDAWNGSTVIKLGRSESGAPTAEVLWRRDGGRSARGGDVLHVLMAPPMVRDGFLYGVHSRGELRCLDALTGDVKWETLRPTTGTDEGATWCTAFLVPHEAPGAANGRGRTFIANELGDLIIADLTPQGYAELSRAKLLAPTNHDAGRPVLWSHPAFANRSVYWRNDKELLCASLAAE